MKKKELQKLAKQIAKCEYVVSESKDELAIQAAQQQILNLTSHVSDMRDFDLLDELIQEELNRMS